MDRVNYKMNVIYEGSSVFDNAEFFSDRLFLTEMIGGTIMFHEEGILETDLDRFYIESKENI